MAWVELRGMINKNSERWGGMGKHRQCESRLQEIIREENVKGDQENMKNVTGCGRVNQK